MLGEYSTVITLTALGYVDLKIYRIPNAILIGWLLTIITNYLLGIIPLKVDMLVGALVTVGIFYPLRQAVRCNAGDFKLYAVMMLTDEPLNIMVICFITMIISLIPLVSGVKKVPLAFMTLFGYIAFHLFIGRL